MLINYLVVLVLLFFALGNVHKYFSLFVVILYVFLRGDYGNDYDSYLQIFNEIKRLNINQLSLYSDKYLIEIGWVYLNWFFAFLGLGFIGFIYFWNTLYLFLLNKLLSIFCKNNVEYNLLLSFFVLDPDFLLTHFSILRQAIPLLIMYIVFSNLKKYKFIHIVAISLVCVSLHNSAIIAVLFLLISYLFFRYNLNFRKYNTIYYIIISSVFFYFLNYQFSNILSFVYSNFERYQFYLLESQSKQFAYGLSYFWVYTILLFYVFLKDHSRLYNVLFLQFTSYSLIMPLALFIGVFTRFSFYFQFSFLLVVLELYRILKIRSIMLSNIYIIFAIIFPLIYKSYSWFYQDTWVANYFNY